MSHKSILLVVGSGCIVMLIVLALILSASGQDPDYIPPDPVGEVDGEQLYEQLCAVCHGHQGQGAPGRFPPLINNPRVVGDIDVPVRVILHGMTGEVIVEDIRYNGIMPPFGHRLSNKEIAAVLNYVRKAWTNNAAPLSTGDVHAIREQYIEHNRRWTVDDFQRP